MLALGKLGGREMTVGSDLDLIFLYDVPAGSGTDPQSWDTLLSDGGKPLAPIHYYARLSQRLINAISAMTAEGRLYEVDMRLRPSGNAGPIASSLDGFRRYQEESAWTWEHMSLTRARVISGQPDFAAEIARTIQAVLARPRDPAKLAAEIADMRARVAEQNPGRSPFDVKYRPGGLLDVEFIAQYLLLHHAAAAPDILTPSIDAALQSLGRAGFLEQAAAVQLAQAGRLWRRLQGIVRLTVGKRFDESKLPEGMRQILARAGGAVDFSALRETMEAAAVEVRSRFESIVGAPARISSPQGAV